MAVGVVFELDAQARLEEAEAWARYLSETRAAGPVHRYEEVEPWAWRRLGQQLTAVRYRLKGRLAAA